ncbi:MAG: hypothetical protein RLZZ46_992 [Bacteroidota bacterium]
MSLILPQSYTLKHSRAVFVFFVLTAVFFSGWFSSVLATVSKPVKLNEEEKNCITGDLFYLSAEKRSKTFPVKEKMQVGKEGSVLNLGFTNQDYWFYFSMVQMGDRADWVLEFPYPFHDLLEVWVISEGKDTIYRKFSDKLPFDFREVKHRNFILPIRLEKDLECSVFCRLTCEGEASSFPVSVSVKDVFYHAEYKKQLMLGLYYGILLFAWLLSVFLFLRMRENAQLFYLLYISSLALFQLSLDGYAFQFFWPHSPWFANHMIPALGSMTLLFLAQFSQSFLRTKTYNKFLSGLITVISILLVVLFIFSLFENPFYSLSLILSNLIALPLMLSLLAAALNGLRHNITSARYFTGAFLLLIIGSSASLLKNLDFLPRVFVTEYGIQIGSAVEIMMLSFGLAENLKILKTENEMVQARLLQELEEKYLIQQRAKEELEKKVLDRTKELRERNEEIATKNKDITDSINYAFRIQQATLPSDEDLQALFPESFVIYKPRDIVSGDFYWAGSKGEKIFIAVADCTGHGVPGSLMSMAANSFLNEIINVQGLSSPSSILEVMREKIIQLLRQDKNQTRDGMDIALLVIDHETGMVQFSGAYNPAYLLRKGKEKPHEDLNKLKSDDDMSLWSLPANRFPVGKLHDDRHETFVEISFPFRDDDIFLMFTDGFADQFGGEKGKKLKYATLQNLLFSVPLSALPASIEFAFSSWKGNLEQVDDLCILGFKITSSES